MLPAAARATCTSPAGAAGDLIYSGDYHIPEYCNNVSWVAMAPTVNLPTTNGLVGYWKLDDGSGTSAIDSSGNGNTGTLKNSPTWTTAGYYNGALTLVSASTQYVQVPASGTTNPATITISLWVNLADTSATYRLFETVGSNTTVRVIGGAGAHFQFTGNVFLNGATTTIQAGKWYHVVAVGSSAGQFLYVNGVLDGFNATPDTINSPSGFDFGGSISPLNGTIDDVRVYNRALSAAEITTLYNYHISPPSSGLVARWKFDESGGTVAADSSGNGNTGTLVNSPTFTSAGKLAGALTFNGTNNYVSVPYNAALNPAKFSVGGWAYLTGGNGKYRALLSSRDITGGANRYGYLIYATNGEVWQMWTGGGVGSGWQLMGGSPLTYNAWTHVMAVYDGTTAYLYINGALSGSAAIPYAPTTENELRIGAGANEGPPQYNFPGKIDDMRVYNRALSADEIYGLYRTSSPVCSNPSGYEGDVMYNNGAHHVLQFCDSAGWRALGPDPGAGGGGCSNPAGAEGDMIYNSSGAGSGVMQYCDGTTWIHIGGPNLPSSGLVGYWKLDETSGASAADSSGNGNTGILTNGPIWVTGKDGGALTFNGTNQYVLDNSSVTGLPTGNVPFSVTAWVNEAGPNSSGNPEFIELLGEDGAGGNKGLQLYVQTNGYLGANYGSGTGVVTATSNPLSYARWYLVAYVYTGSQSILYVNGVTSGSSSYSNANLTYDVGNGVFAVGAYYNPAFENYFFNGTIDDVRVYNRALSAQEVWQLYSGT